MKGTFCECGNPKAPTARACPRCTEIEHQRTLAESPSWRVMVALKRYDGWASAFDLAVATDDSPQRVGWSLRYWMRRGMIETCGEGSGTQYRMRRAA
jgi:hypothetical protein